MKKQSDISFSNIRAYGGLPCIVEGSSQTTIRNVQFNDLAIRTTGPDALICRHCEGIKLHNVELSNVPASGAQHAGPDDGSTGARPAPFDSGAR